MDRVDPDDLFKRFFGSAPGFGGFGYRGYGHGHDDSDQWSHGGLGEDIFGDFHREFHKQMEEMDRQMREVFRIFRIADIPSVPALPETPGEAPKSPSKNNPRNFMLKDGVTERITPPPVPPRHQEPESPSAIVPSNPEDELTSLFEKFFNVPRWNRIRPQDKKDTDLDEETPSSEELADLFQRKRNAPVQRPLKEPSQPQPFSFFSGNSVSVRTVIGPDGVMEERRTVRDSSGREETTVTRRIGDSSHSVTTIKDETGRVEKQETFENVDKDKLSEFDRQWEGQKAIGPPEQDGSFSSNDNPSRSLFKSLSDDTHGIFRRLFGFSLK